MRYPDFLKDNGTIGFVAPSFGAYMEPYKTAFDHALEKIQKQGFKTDLGPNCYAGDGIGISTAPEKCAAELMEYYCSEKNDAIISCGGGELMCGILDYMDFEKIKSANPKWYMGYSDNTNFTFLLTTICDTASIYGPCASSFGMEPWHPYIEDSMDLLQGKTRTEAKCGGIYLEGFDKWEKESLKSEETPLATCNVTEPSVLHLYKGKADEMGISTIEETEITMEGRLLGGCLDILVMLCGTEYDYVSQFAEKYKEDGIIWFLEACDLNMMSIRRAMWQLEHAGWFKYVKGFVIGRPRMFGENMMGLDQYKAVYDVISHYEVPIIMDADIGHVAPMVPLICGSMAKVHAVKDKWDIEMFLK